MVTEAIQLIGSHEGIRKNDKMRQEVHEGTYQPPPQCVGVGVEVLRFGLTGGVFRVGHVHGDVVLLHQVDQEGCQDQGQEADVPGRDEFLHGRKRGFLKAGEQRGNKGSGSAGGAVLTLLCA